MVTLVTEGTVTAIDGSVVSVRADSLCVHGDSPGATDMAARVRAALSEAGIGIEAFAPVLGPAVASGTHQQSPAALDIDDAGAAPLGGVGRS
jgi:UPF0271 protein